MTRSQKEQYKWLGFGIIGGVIAGAILPNEYNPVELIKPYIGGVI